MNASKCLKITLLLLCFAKIVTTQMDKAGIVKAEGNAFVKKFHSSPDAYLGWEVRNDGTIWFDLDCLDLDETQYCGFSFSAPDQPTAGHHDTDIYTAHGDRVEDMHAAANRSAPPLDRHRDVRCDHCSMLDGRLHATFFRNLSTGDTDQDVSIDNRTYRVGWAIGLVTDGRAGAHNFTPRAEREYMYINFIDPAATVVPNFDTAPVESAAGSVQMALVTLMGAIVLPLWLS